MALVELRPLPDFKGMANISDRVMAVTEHQKYLRNLAIELEVIVRSGGLDSSYGSESYNLGRVIADEFDETLRQARLNLNELAEQK